jgi:hypothetical protein
MALVPVKLPANQNLALDNRRMPYPASARRPASVIVSHVTPIRRSARTVRRSTVANPLSTKS